MGLLCFNGCAPCCRQDMFFTFYDITTLNSTYQDKLKAGVAVVSFCEPRPPDKFSKLAFVGIFRCKRNSKSLSTGFDSSVWLKRHSKETPPCTLGRGGDLIMASDMKPPQFEARLSF